MLATLGPLQDQGVVEREKVAGKALPLRRKVICLYPFTPLVGIRQK